MSIIVETPFQNFTGLDGKPLTNGKVYIGQVGTDPTVFANQIPVFWDEDLTEPAAQPLTTNSGYIVRTGTPARVYAETDYSMSVKNSSNILVYYVQKAGGSDFASLATLASSAGASLIGWIQSGIGAIYRTVMDKLRENVSALDFGALNDGLTSSATVNRTSIQEAIDYLNSRGGGIVTIGGGGVYYVDLTPYYRDSGVEYGVTTIKMKDNVSVKIEDGTTIRLIPNAYGAGAYYRMFSSRDESRLTNSAIYGGGTIDGNRANQISNLDNNASNIQLEVSSSVRVQGIKSINAKGMGIQIRGIYGTNAGGIIIKDNLISGIQNIGIQVSLFQNLVIADNVIVNCVNNAIDIYGENGTTTCQSFGFSVTGNVIDTALTGVFCETVRNGIVSGNHVTQCTYGYIVNRINGQPKGIEFSGGSSLNCTYGIRVTGDTGGISFDGMSISDFSAAGAQLGQGSTGSVSYVSVTGCKFIPSSNTVPIIAIGGATSSFNSWDGNTVTSAGITSGFLVVDSAGASTGNISGNFVVLPSQVGKRNVGEISGTFTPVLSGSTVAGTQTYSARAGSYSKIGKVVSFSISIALSAKDAATSGSMVIDGLPFISDSSVACGLSVTQAQFVTLTAGYTQFSAGISPSSSRISMNQIGSNMISANIPASAFSATTSLIISGSYLAVN